MSRPLFSNGSEHDRWIEHNCDRCAKFHQDLRTGEYSGCDMLDHLDSNQWGDPLPPEIEARLGCDDQGYALGECKELEAT